MIARYFFTWATVDGVDQMLLVRVAAVTEVWCDDQWMQVADHPVKDVLSVRIQRKGAKRTTIGLK